MDNKLKTILKMPKHTKKLDNIHIYKVPYRNDLSIVPIQVQPIARLLEGYLVVVYKLINPFI